MCTDQSTCTHARVLTSVHACNTTFTAGVIGDVVASTALHHLDLASNSIYGEGARAIAAAIAINQTLFEINLVGSVLFCSRS